MLTLIPDWLDKILEKLQDENHPSYLVGGAVRDYLLGKEPGDFDIATPARPDELREIFKEEDMIDIASKFGTVMLLTKWGKVEITSFRQDSIESDGRRPKEVIFTRDLETDLKRRDFTINALAYNKREGLIDLFNGRKDLENKRIVSVGDPIKRFKEDYLRILRCVRFASSLGFTIDVDCLKAGKELRKGLNIISKERIRDEFFKIMESDYASYGLRILKKLNILDMIIPEIKASYGFNQENPFHQYDLFEHTMRLIDELEGDLSLRLAGLFHDLGKPGCKTIEGGAARYIGHEKLSSQIAIKNLKNLKAPNKLIDDVNKLVLGHMSLDKNIGRKGIKRLINQFGEDIDKLFKLIDGDYKASREENFRHPYLEEKKNLLKEIIEEREVYNKKQLIINGRDLIDLGYEEGIIIGQILNFAYEIVLEDSRLNDREKLVKIIRKRFPLGR